MHHRPTSTLTRRGLLGAGAALGVGALLGACGTKKDEDGGGDDGPAKKDGGWAFTDDRDEKVTADSAPQRIVAYVGAAAVLHDLGLADRISGVFGPTTLRNGRPDVQAGDLDVDRVTVLGNAWGEFNLEKYVGLEPELLVTSMFQPPELWYVPEDSRDKILALAPSVGIATAGVPLPTALNRYVELARSLGADLTAPGVTRAKARFEKAEQRLRRVAGERGGIRVLAGSAAANLFYVSDPSSYADLSYFLDLGIEFVVPENPAEEGFWESMSWENADRYPADVILLDNRTGNLQPKDLARKPTWARLPAVRADQVLPWLSEPRFSWAGFAPVLEELATALEGARTVR